MKFPAVYIVASGRNGTLYTGVTSDLPRRIDEHKKRIHRGFAARYNCTQLVYYERHDVMESAIIREKQIKDRSRAFKMKLIESTNPDWCDLFFKLF